EAELEDVAVADHRALGAQRMAVDVAAVGRAEVGEHEAAVDVEDARVLAAERAVLDRQLAVRAAADLGLDVERVAAAVFTDEEARRAPAILRARHGLRRVCG